MPCLQPNDAIPSRRQHRPCPAIGRPGSQGNARTSYRQTTTNPCDRRQVQNCLQHIQCPRRYHNPLWIAAPAPHAIGHRESAGCHRWTAPLPTLGQEFRPDVEAGAGHPTGVRRRHDLAQKDLPGMRKSVPWLQGYDVSMKIGENDTPHTPSRYSAAMIRAGRAHRDESRPAL